MKPEKEKNVHQHDESESNKISEPTAVYGNQFTLNLDETKRYTYADYLTWFDDKRRELINGFIKMMSPAATTKHAKISAKLVFELTYFIKKRKGKCLVFNAPFDVRLPTNKKETENNKIYTVVQPDICLICDLSKLDEKGCLGAPELIIEIQSPSTSKYDLTEKFDAYELAGVPEYWVVFAKDGAILVFLLQPDGKYDRGTLYEFEGKVPVKAIEGLEIDLDDIFKEL